jgi:uncharacterized protein (DUF433 family)
MVANDLNLDQLIEYWVDTRAGVADAVVSGAAVPIWALVGYLATVDHDPARVAVDYDLPMDAVRAALGFYARHAATIDARIDANTLRVP